MICGFRQHTDMNEKYSYRVRVFRPTLNICNRYNSFFLSPVKRRNDEWQPYTVQNGESAAECVEEVITKKNRQ